MTTVLKQNWAFSELVDFVKDNPWKLNRLKNYVPSQIINDREHNIVENGTKDEMPFGLKGMRMVHLRPSGLISLMLWIKNPLFRDAPTILANKLRREFATDFQETLDSRVKGGPYLRKKKKIQEWFGNLMNERGFLDETSSLEFAKIIPDILDIQIIWIRSEKKENGSETHVFFSTNPHSWVPDKSTFIADLNGTWILEMEEHKNVINIYDWLQNQVVKSNWIIDYPVIDPTITKVEILDRIRSTVFGGTIDTSLKKDILIKKLAVYETILGLGRITYGA